MGNFGRIQIQGGQSDSEMAGKKRFDLTYEDETGKRVALTEFDSMADMMTYMELKGEDGRSLYDTNPSFRESVKDVARNSPALFTEQTLARRSPIPNNQSFLETLKQEALRQTREELTDKAGGKDAVAKYNLAMALTNPDFAESAQEMKAATEVSTPIANMLRARKQAGLGPVTYNEPIDTDADDKREADHNAAILSEYGDSIITLDK